MTGDEERVGADSTSIFQGGLIAGSPPGEGPGAEASLSDLPGPAAGSVLLVVKRGPNVGSRFDLTADVVTAGRHPDSDVFLDDVSVSRRHAEFRRGPAGYEVVDVGSLNGTYVNRESVESSALVSGDEVQIGKFRLVYLVGASGDGAEGSAAS